MGLALKELIVVVQSVSHVLLFVTPWTAAGEASLSSVFLSLLKFMSIELVLPSYHISLSCPLLLPSVFPSVRVFSSESALRIRWLEACSFGLSASSRWRGQSNRKRNPSVPAQGVLMEQQR